MVRMPMIKYLFNKIILNIFHNFIPKKIIISRWFNDKTLQILNKKNELFKQFIKKAKLQNGFDQLKCMRSDLVESITRFFYKQRFLQLSLSVV